MKRIQIASIALFLLPLFSMGVASLLLSPPTVSMRENRALKPMPEFSWDALWAGTYTRDVEKHYADTFPMREQMMSLSGFWDRLLTINTGQLMVEGDFDLGFGENLEEIENALTGGPTPFFQPPERQEPTPVFTPAPSSAPETVFTPEPTPTPTPEPTPEPEVDLQTSGGYLLIGDRIMHSFKTDPNSLQKYADMLQKFASQMPETQVYTMVVPNSYPFYAPSTFLTPEYDQRDMIQQLYGMIDTSVVTVNVFDLLEAHRDEYLYFRSDHHWTARGAYWAYTGFCDALGFEPVGLERFETGRYEGFLGSFYRDLSKYPQADAVKKNSDAVEYFLPVMEYTAEVFDTPAMTSGSKIPVVNTNLSDNVSNKYICFTNGDQPLIRIRTQANTGRKLLVVKESYGNALIPVFTSHFDEIYVVDFRRFNNGDNSPRMKLPGFVSEHGVTDVIFVNYPEIPNSAWFIKLIGKLAD